MKGLRTVDQFDVKEMVLPLAVIDVHEKAAADPDYMISMDDIRSWEKRHGCLLFFHSHAATWSFGQLTATESYFLTRRVERHKSRLTSGNI
ncbi:MAG: hypothetical protein A4E65_03219 [Syntrophorhabdus sp. PtaU1.Bin153]|nr:MAG: hypothetical protein A4E65_03219 [Syntrophorhabdus sp. PtaU1.Bin153]